MYANAQKSGESLIYQFYEKTLDLSQSIFKKINPCIQRNSNKFTWSNFFLIILIFVIYWNESILEQ